MKCESISENGIERKGSRGRSEEGEKGSGGKQWTRPVFDMTIMMAADGLDGVWQNWRKKKKKKKGRSRLYANRTESGGVEADSEGLLDSITQRSYKALRRNMCNKGLEVSKRKGFRFSRRSFRKLGTG